jgi:hypothetical protein
MKKFLITITLLISSFSALAADGFSSLEEQMSGKEYTAAGLDKLTPEELEALNNWLRRHSVATLDAPRGGSASATAAAAGGDTRGLKTPQVDQMERTTIHTRIVGKFSGWDGHTTFKLENGMIWEQDDKDKFYIKEVENPEVTIEPGMFKSWHLSVVGHNSRCRVERVQ